MKPDEYGHVMLDPLLPEIRVSPSLLLQLPIGSPSFGEMGKQLAMLNKQPAHCAEEE